jgi:hypothetical protein
MFKRTALTILVFATLFVPAPAVAQDSRAIRRDACAADYQRLCPGVTPGGGRVRKCMHENSDKLSSKCRAALAGQGQAN